LSTITYSPKALAKNPTVASEFIQPSFLEGLMC
jgi:hypothetical protein